MTEDQLELLLKARDSLAAARHLLQGGFVGFAASRAYYTMFYVVQAFLEGEEMSFSKHSATIAAFGRHLAHTGKVPVEFHRHLLEAEKMRHAADYSHDTEVTSEQAQAQIAHAQEFLDLAERLIGPLPPTDEPPA